MATLASRIQERATQFIAEQSKLQSLEDELQLAVASEQQETQRTREILRTLLEMSHDRFGIEREICDLNEQIEECDRLYSLLRTDAQKLEESSRIGTRKMERDIKKVYASHDTGINVYYKALDSAIVRRKRKLADYQEQDERIRARIAMLRTEEQHFLEGAMQLEVEIRNLKGNETQSDMAITSLAKQVQESLAKRVSLRQSLKESLDDKTSSDEDT